jgi:hypothetical protein
MKHIEGEFLVLREETTHENFAIVAKKLGWLKSETYLGDSKKEPFEEIWTTTDQTSSIHYVDEPTMGTRYLWVRGRQLSEIIFDIYRQIPAYEPDELIESAIAAKEHNEVVDSLFRIAVGFANYDRDAFRVFEAYLTDANALLREATVQALAFRLWPQSIERLKKVATEDSSENVRQFAQTIVNYAQEIEG